MIDRKHAVYTQNNNVIGTINVLYAIKVGGCICVYVSVICSPQKAHGVHSNNVIGTTNVLYAFKVGGCICVYVSLLSSKSAWCSHSTNMIRLRF